MVYAIWPAPVQFWERSVWETKNSNVHLKMFNYTLGLTFQPFKRSKDSSPSRCEVYFHCSVKRACVKVTCVLFTKCYFVANPANWLNIVRARTVFENESKVKMHFKWSCWQNFSYWDKKNTPPAPSKLHRAGSPSLVPDILGNWMKGRNLCSS